MGDVRLEHDASLCLIERDLEPPLLRRDGRRIQDRGPVPMLGNRTPRESARSKQGRNKLADWIKEIENGELGPAGTGPNCATGLPRLVITTGRPVLATSSISFRHSDLNTAAGMLMSGLNSNH